ncbi:hypothetical protein [Pedobacter nyackensis]|uniref:hypothetical protein n=1 Tax=Pedobacter nyackensis TaxID=475255 RepID=UPI00292F520D|nr:hypothetical protein [Pedobacter nyackensis]
MMKEVTIKVPKTIKYITELSRFKDGFPNNKIYIKTLPGWGATHGEVKIFPRHSICVNPHVPVIEEKEKALENGIPKYPNMLVVYDKVTENDVKKYLENDIEWKKILCTPEAYLKKVKPAIENSTFDLYKDFYMLLDECDKIIKDVNYRVMIEAPMDDFFTFKNKGMISATALIPSDPRFDEHGFEIYRIVPDYDYSQDLALVMTNNIIASLERIAHDNPNERFFIFINSATHIHAIIKALGISKESKVYCSLKSVRKLRREGFENAAHKLEDYPRFIFFTSRYFTAVDIFLNEKPIVVMITDIYDEKTLLDPYTDNVQIVGRARNGVKAIYHVAGTNPELDTIDEALVRNYLMDSYATYQDVKGLGKQTNTLGGIATIGECLSGAEIKAIIREDGSLNYNRIDNYMHDNNLKIAYKSQANLLSAYSKVGNFKVNLQKENYDATHRQMLTDYKKEAFKERCKNVAQMIDVWRRPITKDGKMRFTLGDFLSTLEKENPGISDYYNKLGYDRMEKCGFDKRRMDRELTKLVKNNKFNDPNVRREVHHSFSLLIPVEDDNARIRLTQIYIRNGYNEEAKASHLDKFFKCGKSTKRGKHIRVPNSII